MTIYSTITKNLTIHKAGHIFWWRTNDGIDYAISISDGGTIRFTNLHTHELKNYSLRLDKFYPKAFFIQDEEKVSKKFNKILKKD